MPGPVVIDDGGSIRLMNKDGKMDELVVVDPKTHQSHDTAIGPFSKITVSYLNINGAVTSLTNDMPVDLKVGDEFHVNSGKLHIDGKIIAGQNCEITIRGEHQDPIVYGPGPTPDGLSQFRPAEERRAV